MTMIRKLAQVGVGVAVAGVAWFLWSGTASASPAVTPGCEVANVSYSDGTATAATLAGLGGVKGDHLTVTFTVPTGCTDELTFASYRAPQAAWDPANADQQVLFSYASGTFGPGTHILAVDVFGSSAGGDSSKCSPQHDNSKGTGANQSPGPYDPTCDGSASQNGKSTSNSSKKPCAGCVGNADAKNPPGQYPNGNDPNAGYECDRNQGVGQTNPAHTGCQSVQVDFAYGPVITKLGHGPGGGGFYNEAPWGGDNRLIDATAV